MTTRRTSSGRREKDEGAHELERIEHHQEEEEKGESSEGKDEEAVNPLGKTKQKHLREQHHKYQHCKHPHHHHLLETTRRGLVGKFGWLLGTHKYPHQKKRERLEKAEHFPKIHRIRVKIAQFLENPRFQYFLVALLLVEVVILVVELLLLERTCEGEEENEEEDHAVHVVEEVLFWFTVTILSIFALELLTLFFALGLDFIRHPLYVVDALIVAAAFVIEVVLRDTLAGSLLLMLRLWRIIRIAHGIITAHQELHHQTKKDLHVALHRINELEKLLAEARGEVKATNGESSSSSNSKKQKEHGCFHQ